MFEVVVLVWTTVHLTAFHSTWMLHFKCSLHRTLCILQMPELKYSASPAV